MRRWRPTGRPRYPRTLYQSYDSEYTTAPIYRSPSLFQNPNGVNSMSYPSNVDAIQGQLTSLQNSQLKHYETLESHRKEIHQGFITMSEDLYEIYRLLESLSDFGSPPMEQYMPENHGDQSHPVCISEKKTIINNSIPQTSNTIIGDAMTSQPSQYNTQSLRTVQQEALSIGAIQSELDKIPPQEKFKEVESAIKRHQARKKIAVKIV